MSTRRLFIALLFVAFYAFSIRVPLDPDMWWHLETGKYIIENGIPYQDPPFSYTMEGKEWITHEWLTDIMMYWIYDSMGLLGLGFIFALFITISFALLFYASEGQPYIAGLMTFWGIASSLPFLNSRPQMFNILWGALVIYIVEKVKRKELGSLWLWSIPLIILIWVNMHGGFLLGIVIMGVYVVGDGAQWLLQGAREEGEGLTWEQVKILTLATIASFFIALVNPHTYQMWTYAIATTLTSEAMQEVISEWQSPNFHFGYFWIFGFMFFASWLFATYSKRRFSWTDALFIIGTGYASFQSQRNIPLFVLVAVPIMSKHLLGIFQGTSYYKILSGEQAERYLSPQMKLVNWVVLLAMIAGATAYGFDEFGDMQEQLDSSFPIASIDYLEAEGLADKRIYNEYAWGGYFIWRGIPSFIDGRADLFGDEFIYLYMGTYNGGPNWEQLLNDYDIELILIRKNSPLSVLLQTSPNWELLYEDHNTHIFEPQSLTK